MVMPLRIGDSGPGRSIKFTRGHLEVFTCFSASIISSEVKQFLKVISSMRCVKFKIIALLGSVIRAFRSLPVRHFLPRVANNV